MLYGYFFISLPPRFARFYAFSRLIAFFSRLALIFDKLCGTCRSFLMAGTLRSRTAESYANAGVRPVAITTPEIFNIKSIY